MNKYGFIVLGLAVGTIYILHGYGSIIFMVIGAALYALFDNYNTFQIAKKLQKRIEQLEDEIKAENKKGKK